MVFVCYNIVILCKFGGSLLKYIKQVLIILGFCAVGEVLEKVIPFPCPAAIYGFVLLFLALCTGILKKEDIAETARFLISLMGLLFVPPAVNLLAYLDIIAPALVPICVIILSSTFVVFVVAGLVTQVLRRKGEQNG